APSYAILAWLLGNQEHLTRRLASLEGSVRIGRVLQRELELGAELELAVPDPAQELVRALEQLGPRDDVMIEGRASHEQRSLGIEHSQIEWPDGAARLAVERHHPPRRQAVESLVERRLPDRIVDDLKPLAVGEPFHLGLEVLLRVEDHVRGPSLA